MINLHRLNGQPFMLNALYIEQLQSFPETTKTHTNGKKIVVLDQEEDVMLKVTEFYRLIGLIKTNCDELGGE